MNESYRRNHEGTPQVIAGSTAGASGAGDHGIGVITCRHCGVGQEVESITRAAGWYLEHAIREHWEMAVKIHEATTQQLNQAHELIHERGWN